jgi:murein DD-endopeptidase MepM/ murein hydrolase activator NlpD
VLALTSAIAAGSGAATAGVGSVGSGGSIGWIGSMGIRAAAASGLATAVTSAVRYRLPVPAPIRIIHGFQAPVDPFGAGERGVDLAARPGEVVRAAADGRVSFAGSVAGRGLVVISHADAVTTEYEPVRPLVSAGSAVAAGTPIGRVVGHHRGCRPNRCLHWGARYQGVYIDPLSLLRPLGPVRLLPDP